MAPDTGVLALDAGRRAFRKSGGVLDGEVSAYDDIMGNFDSKISG
jgi:hypothetical protein